MLGESWTWSIATNSSRVVYTNAAPRPGEPPVYSPSDMSPPSDLSREIDATSATGRVK